MNPDEYALGRHYALLCARWNAITAPPGRDEDESEERNDINNKLSEIEVEHAVGGRVFVRGSSFVAGYNSMCDKYPNLPRWDDSL